jgi:uncharacterized 2Fe-2S/4Fe-4S cluster protein (DUF4445 family)
MSKSIVTIHIKEGEQPLLCDVLTKHQIRFSQPCGGRGLCKKCLVSVKGSCIFLNHTKPIEDSQGFKRVQACQTRVTGVIEVQVPKDQEAVVAGQGDALDLTYDDGKPGLGIAIDIGTTTISVGLYDLLEEKLLQITHVHNLQQAHGADVLSRIDYANRGGLVELQNEIVSQLEEILESQLKTVEKQPAEVLRCVITGNTTMLHLLCGLNPKGIGVAPFTPVSLFGKTKPMDTLFPAFIRAQLYLAPCISAYVGADITCGMHLKNMGLNQKETILLVDIGTNGEMALCHQGKILCCATAAGPAFEGALIECGMSAAPGAIEALRLDAGRVSVKTIANQKPSGICGSGLISAVSALLSAGVISGSGQLLGESHAYTNAIVQSNDGLRFTLCEQVYLSQKDIRNIQLAKAAIGAGIQTLCQLARVSYSEIDHLWLSGNFGSSLIVKDAANIGLIPDELVPKSSGIGNCAYGGAVAALFVCKRRKEMEILAAHTKEISLSSSPEFMENYIDQMAFYEE